MSHPNKCHPFLRLYNSEPPFGSMYRVFHDKLDCFCYKKLKVNWVFIIRMLIGMTYQLNIWNFSFGSKICPMQYQARAKKAKFPCKTLQQLAHRIPRMRNFATQYMFMGPRAAEREAGPSSRLQQELTYIYSKYLHTATLLYSPKGHITLLYIADRAH